LERCSVKDYNSSLGKEVDEGGAAVSILLGSDSRRY
jgi:hypothetical protein